MELPRLPADALETVMFIRPRNPDNHTQFEWLLPQCTPLFVYADENGRDWVRWSLPLEVAEKLGWDMRCDAPNCCKTEPGTHRPAHAYLVDTAWDEISWFLERDSA